jgi:1,5-anhydro-D-fructose reductase (1,5-anhydro-D-mannitol-forming)
MSQSQVRFAVLGFGLHAVRRLIPAFGLTQESSLVGMWRRNQDAAKEDCAKYGIAHCFDTREELCASPDIDAVFITSPDAMHLEDALLAIRHGKAVLCEKPLAMSAAEAEEMAQAARAAGVVFGVAQNFRWNRSVGCMRERIAAGAIGNVQMAEAVFNYPAQTSARKWIADGGLACGGPIGDVGVHCIDALRYVLGAEVESVATLAKRDQHSGDVEAYASMQMRMTDGVFAQVDVSARAPYRTMIEVTGSDGTLSAENGFSVDRPVDVVQRRAGEVVETTAFDNGDAYALMLDEFAAAVRGGAQFAATVEDGVKNMRVLDAAFRSWKSGQREQAG